MARLNAVLALLAAAQGRADLLERARSQTAAAQILHLDDAAPPPAGAAGGGAKRTPSPPTKARSPSPSATAKRSGSASPKKPGTPLKGGPPQPPPEAPAGVESSPAMASLQYLARSAHQAYRGRAWHELLNSARHLWNCSRLLLNLSPAMTAETPPLVWEQGPPPPPPTAPESSIAPSVKEGGKAGKGAAKAAPKADKADKKGAAKSGSRKGDGDAAAGARLIWLPRGARSNTARHLRSAAQAVLLFVDALRAGGAPLHTGVLPLPGGGAAAAPAADADADDAASYVSSAFSYGSDVQADLWYQRVPVDMAWLNRLLVLVLVVLVRMKRWHAVLELGEQWVSLSEGAFNEQVMPLMMQAAAAVGSPTAGRLQAAMEVVVRDKNQALDQLDKVRTLVRKRLGEASLLGGSGVGSKVRKKRAPHHGRPGTGSSVRTDGGGGGAGAMSDAASMVSAAYTYGTATTFKTKASQPDYMRVPTEYEKVIEFLKKRGEKGAMILATNEMGDVHAHFGNWRGATTAWSDALDTLIGPYQVIKCWRKALEPQSKEQLLHSYGMHGLLLAGGILLGKLARYSHYDNLGTRLEAARMASTLLAAVFCASLVHPQRHCDFATYLPLQLWDRADVFADPYRCNVQDLLSGLETLATILIDNDLSLDALPMLALWDYVSCRVAKSVHHAVRCRLSRARALTQLGLVEGASRMVLDLLYGAGLPDPTLDSDLVLRDEEGRPLQVPDTPPLLSSSFPGDPANQAALSALSSCLLPLPLDTLYGSWAVAHLDLVRAMLLLRLGGFPNLWKATHPHTGLRTTPETPIPEAPEPQLLDQAVALISRALAMAKGEVLEKAKPAATDAKAGAKAKVDKAAAAAAAARKASAGSRPTSPASPDVDDQTTVAQRSEVMVRALLLLSDAELLRWQPARALGAAEEALGHMAAFAERVNATLSDNDDTDRLTLSPGLWLMARLQAVRCTAALNHGGQAAALIELSMQEVVKMNDPLRGAQLLHIQANLQAGRGRAAAALNTYMDVLTRYQSLSLRDPRIACLLMDAAVLRDGLGLRADCERLVGAARVYLEAWTAALGLHEMEEHPELINIYSSGTALYAVAMELASRCSVRRQQLAQAQAELHKALGLVRRLTRAPPTQHAAVALALARVMRMRTDMERSVSGEDAAGGDVAPAVAPPPPGAELLSQARALLAQALTLSTLDGAHQHGLMREALLELASLHLAADELAPAAAALKASHAAACKGMLVAMSSHLLTPVAVAQLPEWALAFARGQEEYFNTSQGKAADSPVTDTELGRLVVRHFLSLGQASTSAPVAERPRLDAQRCMLHAALRAACPRYAAEGCFADVPLPPPPAPGLLPSIAGGAVLVQWHVHPDGCSRESSSWVCSGSLPAAGLTESQLLALQPVPVFASMLFIVVPGAAADGAAAAAAATPKKPATPPTGKDAAPPGPAAADAVQLAATCMGERSFPVALLREVLSRVKALRQRMESPRLATDLFGEDAPSGEELSKLRGTVERLLGQRRWSGGGQLLLGSGLDGDDDELSPSGRGSEAEAEEAEERLLPGGGAGPALDVRFLTQLESMFSLEGGIDTVDPALANWLCRLLPLRS